MTTETTRSAPDAVGLRGYTMGTIRVLELTGECDLASRPALVAGLAAATSAGPAALVVDFSKVTYCDASSAGLLIALAGRVPVVLAGATGASARVLDLLAPRAVLPRFHSVAAAVGALTPRRPPVPSPNGAPNSRTSRPGSAVAERPRTAVDTNAVETDGVTAADLEAARVEATRLAAVHRYQILDTPPDATFDRIAALAARMFGVPIAIISIVDEDRIWFVSHHGTDVSEIGRDPGFLADAGFDDQPWGIPDALLDPRTLASPPVIGDAPMRFYAGAPLITAEGDNLGAVFVLDTRPRQVSAQEVVTLQDLAGLVVDALELRLAARRAFELEAERRDIEGGKRLRAEELARTLQQSLLPPHLPDVPGVDIGARYLPAAGGAQVVGDFYDVFQAGKNSWGIVMGDVCGMGVEAAQITLLARHTLRAAAMRDTAPSRILEVLNQALADRASQQANEIESERFLTAAYLTLRPIRDGVNVALCSAGHTPVLLRRADGVVSTVGDPGTILGLFATAELGLHDTNVRLYPNDMLLLYTDGVTEARHGREFFGDERLYQLLHNAVDLDADALAARIANDAVGFSGGALHDDTAVLVIRVSGQPRTRIRRRLIPLARSPRERG
jgi:sigma-B regulation protein RsbU (phosphoserine phosphatase)